MDKATDWFLEKAELQAHPSVTFHIPESQVEDWGAALGPSFCAHQLTEVQSPRQSPAAFLLQGAPGLPAMGLPHCCPFSTAAPSGCLSSRDWHSQPSAESLKLGLQPCSLSSAPDPPTRKPLATPDHPRLAAPSKDAVKPGGLFPRGHAHPF